VLSPVEEAFIVAFRRHTLLSLDDSSPHQTKASLTHGQVERTNRTLNDATVKRHYYETHDEPRTHLDHFVQA
jgi:hypothetical protein